MRSLANTTKHRRDVRREQDELLYRYLRYVSLRVWTYENILHILETEILLSLGGSVQERNIPKVDTVNLS